MSVSVLLVPLALAAAAAVTGVAAGRDAQGRVVCQVRTRMRDANLLGAALRESGGVVSTDDTGAVHADWQQSRATFQRDQDGIWSAHFTGEVDESRAVEITRAVDVAYGRQVQQAVLQRLRERAGSAGLRLESEMVADDHSVQLVFQVEGRS
ncbi:MAG: hypothetical protein GEU94_10680 [Micromonosporaceae bacterium]|nr:hypothetical protein [Micromonosporaceae bacterium]